MSAWLGRVGVACLIVGCGAKPEAKAPPPAQVETTQIATEPPDLSPVKRPAEVVMVGRIARPRQLVETLAQWSSLPLRIEDLIPEQARGLSRAVLWEAPVEMLVALDAFGEGKVPPPLVVASIGLKSLDEGLSTADAMQVPTRKLAPGVYRVGEFADSSCSLAVSLGSAPARLVCGRSNKDVDTLLPYATRGLAAEPQTGADLELTLDAKPIQERYGREVAAARLLAGVAIREVSLDSPRFDRAVSDAIYGGVDEALSVFNDLDQLRLEARLDTGRSALLASAELRLKGNSSWTAGTIAATSPVEVPAQLPRVPPGATLAAYTTSLPAERYTAIARVLGDLSDGYLEHEKLAAPTRARIRHLLDAWLAKLPETFAFAMSPSQTDELGYLHADTTVTRASEPAPRILGAYTDFFALLSDPALKRWLKQRIKLDEKAWPKVSKKPLKLPGFATPATAFEATFNVKALAAVDSSLGDTLEKALPPADSKGQSRITIIVQPDGAATYVITGDDTKEMARVMAEHKKSEPGARLVKPARSGRVVSTGFATLAYLARYTERMAKSHEIGKAVAASPQHGATPIPFASTTSSGMARVDFEVPAAVFSDASSAAIQAGPALKSAIEKR